MLQAAGDGDLTWDQARESFRVVSVGIFAKTDRRACACGQLPLKQVLHLWHEVTGKPLDIGRSCAKRFRMLGDPVWFLLLAARCLLPLQRLVCEFAEEVKAEMKFQSQAIVVLPWLALADQFLNDYSENDCFRTPLVSLLTNCRRGKTRGEQ